MNELSLFSGAGGGLLGTLLLGWRPIGYVEWNEYCQKVISQRVTDGILPSAPIFGDVREFIRSGAAAEYRGFTDVVTAGWPCQPHSSAGKRKGYVDEREGWPFVIETIRQVQPEWFLGENVPGILSSDSGWYFGAILRDLAEAGYDAEWGVLSACALGAPHTRERLFFVAHANSVGGPRGGDGERGQTRIGRRTARVGAEGDTASQGPFQVALWEESDPAILGVADGVGPRMDRIKAAGNGQVPIVVATAWHLLRDALTENGLVSDTSPCTASRPAIFNHR